VAPAGPIQTAQEVAFAARVKTAQNIDPPALPAAAASASAAASTIVRSKASVQQPAFDALRPTSPAATAKPRVASQPVAQETSATPTSTESLTGPTAAIPEIAATLAAGADDPSLNSDESGIPLKAPAPHIAPGQAPESATPAAGPNQPPQELAFAARVQPAQNSHRSALPAEMASASAVASATKKVVPAADDVEAASAETHAVLTASIAAIERDAQPAAASAPAAPAAPIAQQTEAAASPAENVAKPSAPLQNISLQVNQPGNEPVEVRVVQQGSEVRVSVHSGDTSLNSGLRQGLSELQSRLEETGYRSEMWRPGASIAPVTAAPSAQASTNQSRGGDGQPQQGGSQQEGGRHNPNQSNQPRWVEELESSLGGEKSSGGLYGFGS
jgi:hypothetical protein